ncbi:efflux RND transporter periplasmic adaptor subunit [Paenibacillus sp. WLX2291]|uniref:efflux RND transporter periplasmic adaptor subunit n=1 Tax=Paenibacillus sp. WLX2291 TaxID=3296934 RepID=UPI00398454F0
MRNKYVSWFAAPVAFTVLLAGCSAEQTVPAAVNPVSVTTVKQVPLTAVYDLSGTLQALEESPVSFELGGTVSSLSVDVGDSVNKGTTLSVLDTADLDLKVSEAQQAVSQAQAGVKGAQASLSNAQAVRSAALAGVASANAQVESARSQEQGVVDGAREQEKAQARNAVSKAQTAYNQAESAAKRAQSLYDNGLLTQQENEQAQTTFATAKDSLQDAQEQLSLVLEGASSSDRSKAAAAVKQAQVGVQSAQASVEQASAGLQQAQAGIEQAQASVDQAQVGLDQAQLARSKASLNAPASGVILEKNIAVGQTIAAGSPAFTIGEITKLKVLLPIPDEDISNWKKGQQVSISLYDQQRTGTVTSIYPQTNDNTGTISAEVQIANPQRDWKPGQVVKASRQVQAEKGIMVPVEAVVSTNDEPYVFKEVKGKAVRTSVKTGAIYNNQLVITSGLKAGDIVVTAGADRLFEGDTIDTTSSSSDAAATQQKDGSND